MAQTRLWRNVPDNKRLYQQVVKEAKQKFMVWPSAYASGWVVNTYKKRGGTYTTKTDNHRHVPNTPSPRDEQPLRRWYDENWINVCTYLKTGSLEPCGRSHASRKNYPYCRPEKRITPETPMTLHELLEREGRRELTRRCQTKKQNPQERITDRKTRQSN